MSKHSLSAELTIDAMLGSRFKRAFNQLDDTVDKSTRKMREIGGGFRSFSDVDRMFDRFTRRIDRFTGRNWGTSVDRMTNRFRTGFQKIGTAVTDELKRKFSAASRSSSEKWKNDFRGVGSAVSRRGPPLPVPMKSGALVKSGFGDIAQGLSAAGLLALGAGARIREVFRNTNEQIGRTYENIKALKRQGKNYEDLAKHARSMDKSVSPWLRKIDRVNQKISDQERRLDKLRMARERYNRAQRAWMGFREKFSPLARRSGYAALGAGVATGYAAIRGAQNYFDFDQALKVLQAEGVATTDIPAIREKIFDFAQSTRFSETEIADVLVGMKKDGQAITAELTGIGDLMKLAVAESRDLPTAWAATRTLINTTKTDLAGAIKLQEQLSNATSLSSLNMEQLQYIAGQSLAIYRGITAFESADFLALAGQLGGILRPERIGTGLREFALTLSDAAAGNLAANRQEAFDLLNLNITDEEGKLKDAVSILKEFERAFNAPRFKDKQGQLIGDKIQPILGEIFGREALPTVSNLLFKSEQIAKKYRCDQHTRHAGFQSICHGRQY